eukprot:gene46952-58574_t
MVEEILSNTHDELDGNANQGFNGFFTAIGSPTAHSNKNKLINPANSGNAVFPTPSGSGSQQGQTTPNGSTHHNSNREGVGSPGKEKNARHSVRYAVQHGLMNNQTDVDGYFEDISNGAKIMIVEARKVLMSRLKQADPSWDVCAAND